MLNRHVSTVAQNGLTVTLALERAFQICMAIDGHRSLSYMLGKGGVMEGIQLVAIWNLATRWH